MIGLKKGSKQCNMALHSLKMEQSKNQAMLVNLPKRYYDLQRIHLYENGARNSLSGVQATLFGPTSPLGSTLGGMLTRMGS